MGKGRKKVNGHIQNNGQSQNLSQKRNIFLGVEVSIGLWVETNRVGFGFEGKGRRRIFFRTICKFFLKKDIIAQ